MTRAHVKLLGPCFKTGRMEQGTITTPGMKVREFHPTKGGLTPKGSLRLTEYQLQSGSASSISVLATETRKHANDNQLHTEPRLAPNLLWWREGRVTARQPPFTAPRAAPRGETSARPSKATVVRRVPRTHGLFHPFTSEQFHALLNSLFKVLFNFPSRYLFAIGLACIFSLGWGLPPI